MSHRLVYTVGLVYSFKVKFNKNQTLDWLHEQEDSQALVRYAVGRGRSLAKARREQQNAAHLIMLQRRQQIALKRDKKKRNKVEQLL